MGLKFYRQCSIGKFIYDFYCPEKKLAIELDGASHTSERVMERDKIKSDFLRQEGIRLLRFRDDDFFRDYERVLREITEAVV